MGYRTSSWQCSSAAARLRRAPAHGHARAARPPTVGRGQSHQWSWNVDRAMRPAPASSPYRLHRHGRGRPGRRSRSRRLRAAHADDAGGARRGARWMAADHLDTSHCGARGREADADDGRLLEARRGLRAARATAAAIRLHQRAVSVGRAAPLFVKHYRRRCPRARCRRRGWRSDAASGLVFGTAEQTGQGNNEKSAADYHRRR